MANHLVTEPIPDSAVLFRRIHKHFWINAESGVVSSAAFDGFEMSVNWQEYATAQETGTRDTTGNTVAVVSLVAGFCRTLEQTVVHDPSPPQSDQPANPAHALVRGRKSKPVKHKLRDAAVLVWKLG